MMVTNSQDRQSLEERLVELKRVSKKAEGGNRYRFTALMVVGDRAGKVGVGLGKAPSSRAAIEKGARAAKKHLVSVPVVSGTIPFPVEVKLKAARLFLEPAAPGFGIVVGGPARTIIKLAGIRDISGKSFGSNNKALNTFATLEALLKIGRLMKKYESL